MAMTHHYSSYSSAVDCRTWWLNSPTDHAPSIQVVSTAKTTPKKTAPRYALKDDDQDETNASAAEMPRLNCMKVAYF